MRYYICILLGYTYIYKLKARMVTYGEKTEMKESTIVSKIFQLVNNETSKDGVMDAHSFELGELTLKLWALLNKRQRESLRGKFVVEDAYERLEIEITSELVEIEFIDYSQEFDTGATLAQHGNGNADALMFYNEIQDITQNEKLDLTLEICSDKKYLWHQVNYDIHAKDCHVNVSHYHYYASVYVSVIKSVFNYPIYEDFLEACRKLARHYYDALTERNKEYLKTTLAPFKDIYQ